MACLEVCPSVERDATGAVTCTCIKQLSTGTTLQEDNSWSFPDRALSALRERALISWDILAVWVPPLALGAHSALASSQRTPLPQIAQAPALRSSASPTSMSAWIGQSRRSFFLSEGSERERTIYHSKLPMLLGSGFKGVIFLGFSTTAFGYLVVSL